MVKTIHTISLQPEHSEWIKKRLESDRGFNFSKFVRESIEEAMKKCPK